MCIHFPLCTGASLTYQTHTLLGLADLIAGCSTLAVCLLHCESTAEIQQQNKKYVTEAKIFTG